MFLRMDVTLEKKNVPQLHYRHLRPKRRNKMASGGGRKQEELCNSRPVTFGPNV